MEKVPDLAVTEKPLKMRWVMVSMAFMATVLNYVHRLSFNYLSADGELRKLIPDDAFGYIATAFFVAYMLSNAFSGFVIDKLGTRLGYSLCMAFWTTAGLVHAFAITPLQFGICRFFLGIGEAGNWPAALKLTGEWFPPHERSTASGIFNSGSALGAIIVPPGCFYGRHVWMAIHVYYFGCCRLFVAGGFLVFILYAGTFGKGSKGKDHSSYETLKNPLRLYVYAGKGIFGTSMVLCYILVGQVPG